MSVGLPEQHYRDIDLFVADWARTLPDREAISDSVRTISWSELDRRANQIAHALIASNVRPDEKVAILRRIRCGMSNS
jgi:acyl-CoA synthetase (AMP-forming)/AMP-acid ligase II